MAQEIAMRRLFVTAAAMLVSCGVAHAQSTTTMPAIGATSPLGVPGSTSAGIQTGIPLGATEINPGGLGLAPLGTLADTSSCSTVPSSSSIGAASTEPAMSATSSPFDDGGVGSVMGS